ncbi:hypothetical protein ACIGHN_13510 [Acidovorax sp. NPDC077693]|uniref:hypothetical protein n=1 Tax=unclassified Acidovorax TaxID=2684926 RepID=UPI0037C5CF0F
MNCKTTTIHIIDQPGGGVMVYTTAGTSLPGQRLTPGQALATDLLTQCAHRASDVRYWHGKDKAMELVQELVDPEQYGYAVSHEVFRAASRLLGRPTPSQPGEVPA